MTTDDHSHPESLEAFTSELVAAGFTAVNGYPYPVWRGEIHLDFAALTDAAQMDIVIWPGCHSAPRQIRLYVAR